MLPSGFFQNGEKRVQKTKEQKEIKKAKRKKKKAKNEKLKTDPRSVFFT
jgi:hypothetical protein